jgi:hypothetical protein
MAKLLFLMNIVLSTLLLNAFTNNTVFAAALPEQLRSELESNAKAISPLEIQWTRQAKSSLGGDGFAKRVKMPSWVSIEYFSKQEHSLRYQDGMSYTLEVGTRATGISDDPAKLPVASPYGIEISYNKTNIYLGNPEGPLKGQGRFPSLVIDSAVNPKIRKPTQQIFKYDFLNAAGFWLPNHLDELTQSPRHEILHMLDKGGELRRAEQLEGAEQGGNWVIEVVDSNLIREYQISPTKGYAVISRKDTFEKTGMVARTVQLNDFSQIDDSSLWLPRHILINHFTWPTIEPESTSTPLMAEELTLMKASKKPISDELFMLKYLTPGAMVTDSTLPNAQNMPKGKVTYRVPASLEDLDEVIDAQDRIVRQTQFRRWLLMANVVGILGLIVYLVYRRKHVQPQ